MLVVYRGKIVRSVQYSISMLVGELFSLEPPGVQFCFGAVNVRSRKRSVPVRWLSSDSAITLFIMQVNTTSFGVNVVVGASQLSFSYCICTCRDFIFGSQSAWTVFTHCSLNLFECHFLGEKNSPELSLVKTESVLLLRVLVSYGLSICICPLYSFLQKKYY